LECSLRDAPGTAVFKYENIFISEVNGDMKKLAAIILPAALVFALTACNSGTTIENTQNNVADAGAQMQKYEQYAAMTPEEITSHLTLEEKAAQMVQGAGYMMQPYEMKKNGYGSVLQIWERESASTWKTAISAFQDNAINSPSGIPYIFGDELNHGAQKCEYAVIFPHNIGIGAANDPELTYQMGFAASDEAKMTGMIWHFSPCVASAQDPRWGRTYESYSSDIDIVKALSAAFVRGSIDAGAFPCPKHFLGDGEVIFGTGEDSVLDGVYIERLIDRGDAIIDDARLNELLSVYKQLVDSGVRTVMVSFSSINGLKMHTKKELITDKLKDEWGFDGFVLSDWEAVHNIPGDNLKDKVAIAVNAGIDMLMEPNDYNECAAYIAENVREGAIDEGRVNDAVTRIIRVKQEMGLFADPMMKGMKTAESAPGSDEYRDIARRLAEKSLVLLKNEADILPLKAGSVLCIIGPAADDTGVLCGGLTYKWGGGFDGAKRYVTGGKTILDGFKALADEYNFTVTAEEGIGSADVVILCVGEAPYAEWEGDTEDLSLTGRLGLDGNEQAIQLAKDTGKPVVTLIVAGRNVIYDEYENDWDAVVMCYLPGSEGDSVANVIAGRAPFTGKLPMPYYSNVSDIRTSRVKFDVGYGLVTKKP